MMSSGYVSFPADWRSSNRELETEESDQSTAARTGGVVSATAALTAAATTTGAGEAIDVQSALLFMDIARDRVVTWWEKTIGETDKPRGFWQRSHFFAPWFHSEETDRETKETTGNKLQTAAVAKNPIRNFVFFPEDNIAGDGDTDTDDDDDATNDDDKTEGTACSANSMMETGLASLSGVSERNVPFSVLRHLRIRQRFAPFLPGQNVQLYDKDNDAETLYGGGFGSVWLIQVYPLEEGSESFHFELLPQGGAASMTLYDTEIVDNVQAILNANPATQDLVFRIRVNSCDEVFEVAKHEILEHLGLMLGNGSVHESHGNTIDHNPRLEREGSLAMEEG